MWRFATRRIFLMIPTIGLILILAFLLQNASNDDHVARLINIEEGQGYSSRTVYLKTYEAYAQKLGYDRPGFYFSIRPNYIPKDIATILPLSRRNNKIKLLRQTRDLEGVSELYNKVDFLFDEVEKSKERTPLNQFIVHIDQADDLADLGIAGRELSAYENNDSTLSNAISSLTGVIENLKKSNALVHPRIDFHGLHNRFHFWVSNSLFSQESVSIVDGRSASRKVYEAAQWTLAMSILTLLIVGISSILIALLQIIFEGSWWERFVSISLYGFYIMPLFWVATLMVVFFTTSEYGRWTDIFPSVGIKTYFGKDVGFLRQLIDNASRLFLPVLLLSIHSLAYITKQTKAEIQNSLKKPFILAARSRGLSERQILLRHALPDSLIVYITLISGHLASLFTGSVIIEVIFNIPGLGRLLLDSMTGNDWPVIFIILVLVSIATLIGYLIGDLLLAYLYPQSRQEILQYD